MESKEVVVLQGIGDQIQKSNLVVNPDEFIRIVHLAAAQSRFFEQGIERNPRGFRPGIGKPRYDAAGVWITDLPVTPEKVLRALDALGEA